MVDYLIRQRDYLLDVSRALTSQLSLSEVLRRILEAATLMLGGEAGLIALADRDANFNVRASYGIKPALLHFFAPLLTDIPRSDPQSFRIPELDRKMQIVAQAAGLGLHQVIALPMALGQELVGVVYIFRTYSGSFGPNEIKLLQSFANQAAIAVQNARLYEQVSTEKRRLDAILRHSGDGIMILAPDAVIESINLTLGRIAGWQVEDAAGHHHSDLIQWAHREPGMDLADAIAGGWPLDEQSMIYVEGDLRRQDGGTISVGITYAPLFDSNGQLRNIIGNIRDITKFRAAEEAKSTFISVISHELKTPVSLIKGYASTLRREDTRWDRPTVVNGLTVIEEEADRLTNLIENLLDATRFQAGNLHLHIEPLSITRLVQQVVEKFRVQSPAYSFIVDLPAELPFVMADEQRMHQVMTNLLSNAIKYSPQGKRIEINGQVLNNQEIELWVTDEGVGIEPGQEELIFDRFYRVDNALSRETQGAGLGLYIVRSIIRAHDGRIWAEKGRARGASIHFTLPVSQEQSAT